MKLISNFQNQGVSAALTAASAILLLLLVEFSSGAERKIMPSASSTNNLVILCTNGGDFSAAMAVFRSDVRVLEPQMYMECELLTVHFQTNNSPRVESRESTNVSARIGMIVAETNLLMMARGTTIVGDKAVYTASNEVVVVTGTLVVIETDNSYTYGEQFVFNRRTGTGYAVGPTVVEIKTTGTNPLKPALTPLRKNSAAPPKNDAVK
jgi:lipopolysaccharide assembly outer membrane protein LptD (OstA)